CESRRHFQADTADRSTVAAAELRWIFIPEHIHSHWAARHFSQACQKGKACGKRRNIEARNRGENRQSIIGGLSFIRSEEHTSELQSRFDLVCRLLLEKKNIYTERKCE